MIITKTVAKRGKQIPIEQLPANSKIMVEVQCPVCGKIRNTRYFQIVRNGHDMCQACAAKVHAGKHLEAGTRYGRLTVLRPAEQSGYSVCLCDCGNTVQVLNANLVSGHTLSCGCLQKDKARETLSRIHDGQKREGHPNWKGGVSPERNCIEATAEYKQMRKAVLDRDGHQCIICGSDHDLEIHHLKSFDHYPDDRTDEHNAVTLCRSCHKRFHSNYGLDASPEDFLNYYHSMVPDWT